MDHQRVYGFPLCLLLLFAPSVNAQSAGQPATAASNRSN
jgi:hypothetical protein